MNFIGKLLSGRYELLEKIGDGGMATVYRAKCLVLNRYVAVKILREEFITDEEFVRRFNIEAQSAASLTHPNIVSVYDVGNDGNIYYIVMELIKGKTLKDIIKEDRVLPWKWSLDISIQVASGLEAAHKAGIIHRDIKPHNIIITEDGVAKVTDFGIAKAVSNSTITAFGTTLGSVHYFSPEHAKGGYTDARSDLYSLGVVMYEMVTGKIPFEADTPVSIALKHMQEIAIEPEKVNKSVPHAVNRIIIKTMQKNPNYRYQTASEMLIDLNKAVKDPDGDFVIINNMPNEMPTQRIPTLYDKDYDGEVVPEEEELGFFARHRAVKYMAIVGAGIGLFLLTILIMFFISNKSKAKEVQIPDLRNLTVDEAKTKLEELNLVFEVSSEEYSPDVPAGQIISQDPQYITNYKVLEKSTIKVVVSKGLKMTKIPDLKGKTREEARILLDEAELIGDEYEETSKTIAVNMVIKQTLKAGDEIEAGTLIEYFVSIGTEKIKVPNLLGKMEADARKAITDAKLKVKAVTYEEDRSRENGVVLKQDVASDSEVEEGTAIAIVVNQVQEMKDGKIKVNLKSILNYTEPIPGNDTNNTTGGTTVKKVRVRITADDVEIYKGEHLPTETNIEVSVQGKKLTTINVFVDDVKKASKDIDLRVNNSVLNIN